jgi:hypothetical protein
MIESLLTAENAESAESLWFVVHRKIRHRWPKLTRRKSKIKNQKAKLWYPKGMIFLLGGFFLG